MLLSIFSNTTIIHLIEIFFWMFGAFLIGFYFGKTKIKNNYSHKIEEHEDLNIADNISKIRATKTFERGGKETMKIVSLDVSKNELNFNRIGAATIQNKNNLQEIKGIGPLIEGKLNALGIFTFKQISNFNNNDITQITGIIKFLQGRIERDDWVGQAYNLLNK